MWAWVWVGLALGALGYWFLVGRSLWRKGTRLAHEVERAGEVADRLQRRVDEIQAAAVEPEPYAPDVETARIRRTELAAVRAGRRAAKRARHERTYQRWLDLVR